MLKQIIPFFSKYKKYPFLAFFAILIEVLCEVAKPIIMKQIIDEGIPNKDLGFIV